MEERKILFYIFFFINVIHLVENSCNKQDVKSDVGQSVCEQVYDPYYRRYNNKCETVYPTVKKIISCANAPISDIILNVELESDGAVSITLKVTNSNITVLPTSIFKNTKKLTTVYLENSNIEKIIPGAFNFLDNLNELYLDGNQLTTISDGLFNSLTSMEKLDLSRNQILDISDHAFQGAKLIELSLTHNNISQMGGELLDSLTSLKVFDISWNNLSNVTKFSNVALSSLNLSHNAIDVINFELFPEKLSKIDLSFNSLSEVSNFKASGASEIRLDHNNMRYLEKNIKAVVLDVSYNELETIDSGLFGANLKKINANHNFISSINKDAFIGLYNLEYLFLNNNNLSSIPNSCFKDLQSLTHLDLSRNELSHFVFGTFDNLLKLEVLNISYNKLKDLQQYTFYSLGDLTHLYFQNNEISEIHSDDLKLHMPKLTTVNLDNNNWSCKELLDTIHILKKGGVSFSNGKCSEQSNIHGIKCYETVNKTAQDNRSMSGKDFDNSQLNRFFNEDFTKSIMYKYFNEDFKESNFSKFLESLLNKTSDNAQNFNASYLEKFINELKLNYSEVYNEKLDHSPMFNYFNDDFRKSNFFKYLESLKNQAIIENKLNNSNMEKTVSSSEVGKASDYNPNNYTALLGLLSLILTMLVVSTCIMTISAYLLISRFKKYSLPKKEEVQLL